MVTAKHYQNHGQRQRQIPGEQFGAVDQSFCGARQKLWYLVWKLPKKCVRIIIWSAFFPKKYFFVGFFPDDVHRGRPRVGLGLGICFMAFYSKALLVMLETHIPDTQYFVFPYCILHVYLHASHRRLGQSATLLYSACRDPLSGAP